MANIFQMLKEATRKHRLTRLHELCCKGFADKSVKGFENVTLATWTELMGYYGVLANHQEIKPVLSR